MERETKKLGGRWREILRNYSKMKMERDSKKLGRWRAIPRN